MSERHTQLINTVFDYYATILRQQRSTIVRNWLQLDISIAQVRVLFTLTQQGTTTMSTLAHALRIGQPTASQLVEKLVRADLVQRTEDPRDRRQTLVHLTEEGKDLMEYLSQSHLKLIRLWLSQISEEELSALEVGLEALARVAERTQPDEEPGEQKTLPM